MFSSFASLRRTGSPFFFVRFIAPHGGAGLFFRSRNFPALRWPSVYVFVPRIAPRVSPLLAICFALLRRTTPVGFVFVCFIVPHCGLRLFFGCFIAPHGGCGFIFWFTSSPPACWLARCHFVRFIVPHGARGLFFNLYCPARQPRSVRGVLRSRSKLSVWNALRFRHRPDGARKMVEMCLTLQHTRAPTAWEISRNLAKMSITCLLYTSPSPRDLSTSRMPSSA